MMDSKLILGIIKLFKSQATHGPDGWSENNAQSKLINMANVISVKAQQL